MHPSFEKPGTLLAASALLPGRDLHVLDVMCECQVVTTWSAVFLGSIGVGGGGACRVAGYLMTDVAQKYCRLVRSRIEC